MDLRPRVANQSMCGHRIAFGCIVQHRNQQSPLVLLMQDAKIDTASADANFEALAKYGTDLTANAATLDPVIGRDDEIRRVVRILSRRTKNNPVLVGDPGVGKTAIVEGLAQRIVKNDVPMNLQVSVSAVCLPVNCLLPVNRRGHLTCYVLLTGVITCTHVLEDGLVHKTLILCRFAHTWVSSTLIGPHSHKGWFIAFKNNHDVTPNMLPLIVIPAGYSCGCAGHGCTGGWCEVPWRV